MLRTSKTKSKLSRCQALPAGKALVFIRRRFRPLHVLHSACLYRRRDGRPHSYGGPKAPSVPHGKSLKRYKPAHFRRNLRKEALLTSSDSGEECAAGTVGSGEECAGGTSSSKRLADKPVSPALISELDP